MLKILLWPEIMNWKFEQWKSSTDFPFKLHAGFTLIIVCLSIKKCHFYTEYPAQILVDNIVQRHKKVLSRLDNRSLALCIMAHVFCMLICLWYLPFKLHAGFVYTSLSFHHRLFIYKKVSFYREYPAQKLVDSIVQRHNKVLSRLDNRSLALCIMAHVFCILICLWYLPIFIEIPIRIQAC
jgi:hypothetical protein